MCFNLLIGVLLYVSQETEEQTQSLEDLEFQKLEKEINQGEEKENQNQEVLREMAEYQRLTVTRKVPRVRFSKRACSMSCMFNTAVSAGTASLFYFQTEILTL